MKKGEIMSQEQKNKVSKSTRIAMSRPGIKEKISKSWFKKGQTHVFTRERNQKLSEKLKGHIVTDTTRRKLSKANLGKRGLMKHSDEWKETRSNAMKGNTIWKLSKKKKFDTVPELAFEAELKKTGWKYEKQVYLCGVTFADFYLPEYRIVIYVDGEYWHLRPDIASRDARINEVLRFNGFGVYRFWANDIWKSVKKCVDSILIPTVNKKR